MELKPQVGRPPQLTEESHDRIISIVPQAFKVNTTALASAVAPASLRRWLKQGEEDHLEGNDTISARLWINFGLAQSTKVLSWLRLIEERVPSWQALWELTRAVAKEDYGVDSVEYKELLDLYTKLSESFKRFSENQVQGVL